LREAGFIGRYGVLNVQYRSIDSGVVLCPQSAHSATQQEDERPSGCSPISFHESFAYFSNI
jgi:hypothetical protein